MAASAQAGTGTVTGRVLWCPSMPIPYALPAGAAESAPGSTEPGAAGGMPPQTDVPEVAGTDATLAEPAAPAIYPAPPRLIPRGLPAGAVLVAVQGTALNTRTDENGQFTLSGVPAGVYHTVAAGPVPSAGHAAALRPNVLVTADQTHSLGTLYLTTSSAYGCPGAIGFSPGGIPAGVSSSEP